MKRFNQWDSGLEYIHRIDDLLLADPRERLFQEYIITPFLERVLQGKEPDIEQDNAPDTVQNKEQNKTRDNAQAIEVVPVDIKVSGKVHDYSKYCGKYTYKDEKNNLHESIETPDLCIAKGWKWRTVNNVTTYIATVEIKSPLNQDNDYWIAPGYADEVDAGGNREILFGLDEDKMADFINKLMLRKIRRTGAVNTPYFYDTSSDSAILPCIEKQVGIHLRGINKVIVTDGIRWLFLYKDEKDVCHALKPIDLGKRLCRKQKKNYMHVGIEWDTENIVLKGREFTKGPRNFARLENQIRDFCSDDFPLNEN